MRKDQKLLLYLINLILMFFLTWIALGGLARAEEDGQSKSTFTSLSDLPLPGFNSYQNMWNRSQILRPQLSLDTKPILATVGNVTYRIPRNYIASYLGFPTLRVTYPGFAPLTEQTRNCFDRANHIESNCVTLDLMMRLPLSSKQMFLNFVHNMRIEDRHHRGPFGYEVYPYGHNSSRGEYYTDEQHGIFFSCILNSGAVDAVCQDDVTLDDGNAVDLFLTYDQIGQLANIEKQIRRLIATFVQ